MMNTKTIVLASLIGIVIASGCAVSQSYKEEELGLRKVDLYSEKGVNSEATNYSKAAPGESKMYERSFENAPPMIPHDVEGMMEITKESNACLSCHAPEVAEAVKATAVPASHMYDMRKNTKLAEVSQARYVCVSCHAPQSANEPLVKNEFKADFRQKDGAVKTNLLDTLNEGVK